MHRLTIRVITRAFPHAAYNGNSLPCLRHNLYFEIKNFENHICTPPYFTHYISGNLMLVSPKISNGYSDRFVNNALAKRIFVTFRK